MRGDLCALAPLFLARVLELWKNSPCMVGDCEQNSYGMCLVEAFSLDELVRAHAPANPVYITCTHDKVASRYSIFGMHLDNISAAQCYSSIRLCLFLCVDVWTVRSIYQ